MPAALAQLVGIGITSPVSTHELATSLGFADRAHLTREFRAVIGETPRRYALAARHAAAKSPVHFAVPSP